MSSINLLYFFMLFIRIDISTSSIEQSCISCQTTPCYCSSTAAVLNCSTYLLDLPMGENCTWDIVDFSSRHLEVLDSSKLFSLRMRRLLLKSNLIHCIHDQTFDAIGDILMELDLEMNQLTNVSSKWLNSKLISLKKLNFASNQLRFFTNLDHVQLINLEELNLSRNFLETFPHQIHQWTSLMTLDLSLNKLSNIPRFALIGLNNLTWLSLASNKNLSCIIQDSFKYLKSLKYLDLSNTNFFDLDACIFIQLTALRTLHIESVSLNCTSCWLLIARKNSLQISGDCLNNQTIQHFDSLTDKQLEGTCSKSSIDCSKDYCEPGSILDTQISEKFFPLAKTSSTIAFILGIFGLVIFITFIISLFRWRKTKQIFSCHFPHTTTPTTIITAEAIRRHRRQHLKQIIDYNPAVIESVITHGANMNVPTYLNDETSKNKRKLYNPMFADSPTSDIRQQQQQQQQESVMVSKDSISPSHSFYSEHL